MTDSRHFQPVLGRKFCVESEFEVRFAQIRRPEGKKYEIRTDKIYFSGFLLHFGDVLGGLGEFLRRLLESLMEVLGSCLRFLTSF